jgi:hypothetical protein
MMPAVDRTAQLSIEMWLKGDMASNSVGWRSTCDGGWLPMGGFARR